MALPPQLGAQPVPALPGDFGSAAAGRAGSAALPLTSASDFQSELPGGKPTNLQNSGRVFCLFARGWFEPASVPRN